MNPATSNDYRWFLAGVVSSAGYDLTAYAANLVNIHAVHLALVDNKSFLDFAVMYGILPADQILSNPEYFTEIQGIASYIISTPGYDIADFIDELNKTADLQRALVDNFLQSDFEVISGIPVAEQDPTTNPAYRSILAGIVNVAGYDLVNFITDLPEASALHDALDAHALRDVFATVYGIFVGEQNIGNSVYIGTLFGIVGGTGYNLTDFIDNLTSVIYEWYDTGELKKMILPTGATFEYHKSGNIKSLRYPSMSYQEFEDNDFYGDNRGRIIREVKVDGFITLFLDYYDGTDVVGRMEIYDRNNNLLQTRLYYSSGVIQKIETVDGDVKEFDESGTLEVHITPDGFTYVYDTATGRIVSTERPDGLYYEDLLNTPENPGMITRVIYAGSDKAVLFKTEIYSYTDVNDQDTWVLGSTIMPNGHIFETDSYDRILSETVPGSYSIDYTYYDLTDLVRTKTYTDLSTGNTALYEYDPLSRVKKETIGDIEVTFRYYNWTDSLRTIVVVNVNDPGAELYRFEYRENGTLRMKTEPGMVSTYDVYGRIKSWKINNVSETFVSYQGDTEDFSKKIYTDLVTGNTVVYDYHENGNLKKIVDLSGWHAEYDEEGRLIGEQTSTSQIILYTYHGDSFEINTKRVINTRTEKATLYIYSDQGILIGEEAIPGPVETLDGLTRVIQIEYYDTSKDEYTYHGVTSQVAVHTYTDMRGNEIIKEYDTSGNLVREANADDTSIEYTYNAGNLVRKDYQDGSYDTISYYVSGGIQTIIKVNAFNRATTETYNETTGLKTQSRTWDGKVTTYQYDGFNRLTRQDNANGTYETFTYHGDTDVVDTHYYRSGSYWTRREYRSDGQLEKISTSYGYTTTYAYDGLDRLVSVNYSGGSLTTYEYVGNTNKIQKESYYYSGNLNSWTDYEYYGDSDNLKSRTYNSTYGYWSKYEYDIHSGQLVKTTSSYGDYTCYEYDSLNRLIRTDSSYGYTSIYTYFGNSDTYQTTTYIDEEGRSYSCEYNELGQTIRSDDWYTGGETTYEYDSFGRTTRIDNTSGEYTIYSYVGNYNYTQSIMHRDSSGTVLWGYSYTYYSDWRSKTYTYIRDGNTTTYNYLSNGRLSTIVTSEGTTRYNYDSRGRIKTIVYPDTSHMDYEYYGTSSYRTKATKYDSVGNVVSDEEWTYYNSTGRRRTYTKTDESGNVTLYEYLYNGRLNRMTTDVGTPEEVVGTYSYSAEGRLSRIDYSNGDYETRTYDGSTWRLDTLTHFYAEDSTTYVETYVYYEEDSWRLKEKITKERNGDTVTQYYDEESVLTMEEQPDGSFKYFAEFNDRGQCTKAYNSDGTFTTYEYDDTGTLINELLHEGPEVSAETIVTFAEILARKAVEGQTLELRKALESLGVQLTAELAVEEEAGVPGE